MATPTPLIGGYLTPQEEGGNKWSIYFTLEPVPCVSYFWNIWRGGAETSNFRRKNFGNSVARQRRHFSLAVSTLISRSET